MPLVEGDEILTESGNDGHLLWCVVVHDLGASKAVVEIIDTDLVLHKAGLGWEELAGLDESVIGVKRSVELEVVLPETE